MRILMVQTFYYLRGGDCTYMFNLTRLLEEHGHDVVPFAMRHPSNLPSPYSRHFVEEIDFPALLRSRSPKDVWTVLSRGIYNRDARRRIARLVDEVRPDIAHFHNIHGHLTTSIIGPLREAGIPIVWTLHDYRQLCPNTLFLSGREVCDRCVPNRFYEVVRRRCKKNSLPASIVAMVTMYFERLTRAPWRIQHFITPSRFLRDKLLEGGFDPARITPIPNFVDLDDYRSAPAGDYFVYFGRLSYEKGIDLLIEAVAELPGATLWIVGEGPDEERLRAVAADRAGERVVFKGFRSGDELRRIIAGARFVALPSLWIENLPFSIMEAFASSVPVIASAIGGIPEMIDDGVNGFLLPLGDVGALRDRIRFMLENPGLREEMGARGRRKAEELYDRHYHYEQIMQVYRKVLAGGGS